MGRARHILLAAAAAGILLTGSGSISAGSAGRSGAAASLAAVSSTNEEIRFVELANKERAQRGLSQLEIEPVLIQTAREHSREMMDKNYFDHYSPTAGVKTPLQRYLKTLGVRPTYACVGENLFYCSVASVERGHQAFMRSPAHRENVLFKEFDKIGVGIQRNERGEFWVTQMFLTNRNVNDKS